MFPSSKIEETEQVFGKRWNRWNEAELLEFLEALEPEDLNHPLIIRWCRKYHEFIPSSVFIHLAEIFRVEDLGGVFLEDEDSIEDLRRKMLRHGLLSIL